MAGRRSNVRASGLISVMVLVGPQVASGQQWWSCELRLVTLRSLSGISVISSIGPGSMQSETWTIQQMNVEQQSSHKPRLLSKPKSKPYSKPCHSNLHPATFSASILSVDELAEYQSLPSRACILASLLTSWHVLGHPVTSPINPRA